MIGGWISGKELRAAVKALPKNLFVYIRLDYGGTYWTQRWRRRDALQLARKLTEVPDGCGEYEHDNHAYVEETDEGLFISVMLI